MNKSSGFSSKNLKGKRLPPAMTTHHLRAEMNAGFEEIALGGEIDSKKTSKKISKVDLCMNFVLGKKKISKATIGFDSFEQLQQILKTKKINIANLKSLAVNNEILITPNLWGTLH